MKFRILRENLHHRVLQNCCHCYHSCLLYTSIFGVNTIKWNRRIEPVRYAEAKAAFLTATEEVTMTTINYFFNLLLAKENVGIARQNLKNADKLYEVAKAKRSMGQISDCLLYTSFDTNGTPY